MEYKAGNSISVAYGSTTTLYAQWEETPGPSPDPGGDDDKKEATLVFGPNAGTDTVDNMPQRHDGHAQSWGDVRCVSDSDHYPHQRGI